MIKPQPHAFREIFRYRKAERTRVYQLRPLNENEAELWVVAEGGQKRRSRLLATFTNPDDAEPFLESVELELRAGGWGEC